LHADLRRVIALGLVSRLRVAAVVADRIQLVLLVVGRTAAAVLLLLLLVGEGERVGLPRRRPETVRLLLRKYVLGGRRSSGGPPLPPAPNAKKERKDV
jgi:hypothetical protein